MFKIITGFALGTISTLATVTALFVATTTHYSSTLFPNHAVIVHVEPLTLARLRGLK